MIFQVHVSRIGVPGPNSCSSVERRATSLRTWASATQSVLRKHGGLWFNDEAFVVSRRQ